MSSVALGAAMISGVLASSAAGAANAHSASGGSAPSGTVTSVHTKYFTLKESSGTVVTVDLVSGSTYQVTTKGALKDATVGSLIKTIGPASSSTHLTAEDLAVVPTPPANVATSGDGTVPQGSFFYGTVTAHKGNVITISTSTGTLTITTTTSTAVTVTVNGTYKDVKKGEAVEINGPETSTNVYAGHQINVGPTPAVVGLPN